MEPVGGKMGLKKKKKTITIGRFAFRKISNFPEIAIAQKLRLGKSPDIQDIPS